MDRVATLHGEVDILRARQRIIRAASTSPTHTFSTFKRLRAHDDDTDHVARVRRGMREPVAASINVAASCASFARDFAAWLSRPWSWTYCRCGSSCPDRPQQHAQANSGRASRRSLGLQSAFRAPTGPGAACVVSRRAAPRQEARAAASARARLALRGEARLPNRVCGVDRWS